MRRGSVGVTVLVFVFLAACGKDDVPGPPDGGSGGGGVAGTGGVAGSGGAAGTGGAAGSSGDGGLTWFTTCGDPVCRGQDAHREMPDVAPCTTQRAGQPCTKKDDSCDPRGECNEALHCSDHDPKMQPGGCPISSRRFKTGVAYLGERERLQISDELLKLRLARYQYNDDPLAQPRLGFILEDSPQTPAADPARERVDLYAYLSMAVAALQTQHQQLVEQGKQLERLRVEVDRLRLRRRAPSR